MTFKYIFSILYTCLVYSALAQSITGTVKSETGEGIAYANIQVLNSSQGAVSDKEGNFSLDLNKGTYQVQFSSIGYATKVQEIIVTENTSTVDVILSDNTQNLGEVVVTANKREEDIVKVSTSITSLSAKKIEDTRTWGLGGLTALVPNYTYQELGVPFQQVQSIRGIQVFSENPAVSTYIDDVNNIDILANGFAFTDIERIEVLRGPQGTLFGRNAMGGVINIITKKPTNKQETFAEFSAGNLGLVRSSFGVKTPLVNDKLFLGVTAFYQTQDGYWKNDTTGVASPDRNANGRTVGGENNLYGNLFLKWLPSSKFSATFNLKAQRDWSDASGFFVSQPDEKTAFANPDKIYLSRIGSHERNIVNSALTLKYYNPDFTLTSISAFQNIGLGFEDIDFPGIYHSFYEKEIGEILPPQQVWSQELRINSNNPKSAFQYTVGVYGFTQVGYEPSTNLAFELAPDTYSIFRNESNNAGIAVFGELGYHISDAFTLTGGLRYDYENRESTFNGFGDLSFVGGELVETKPDTTLSGTYTALSPKVVLSYALTNASNLYASYTRGFRAGGVNAQRLPVGINQKFDPEFSNNFELGYKVNGWNNRLSLSAAAFLIQWQDLQFFNLVAPFTYARENVGDAQSLGFEVEAAVIPVKGLQIDASFGLNDTEYKDFELTRVSFVTGAESKIPIGGNVLSNAPSHTLFLGIQYTLPITNKLNAFVRGEVRNIGEFYTDIQNDLQQPAYTLLNARIGLNYNKISLLFWGQNLTDETYLAFGNPDTSFGSRSVRTAAPATYGVTLSAKF